VIIDASAIVTILRLESGYEAVAKSIEANRVRRMSVATLLELWIVTDRMPARELSTGVDDLIRQLNPIIEPVTLAHARIARKAYHAYGKGDHNDSKANLNFGDCFAYALARERNEPLLFVGNDFIHTDITPVHEPSGTDSSAS
jgi:ribonuclease VapC